MSEPPKPQPEPFEINSMSKSADMVVDESVLSRRVVRYGLIWGIWTCVALFFSTQIYMMNYAEKQPFR